MTATKTHTIEEKTLPNGRVLFSLADERGLVSATYEAADRETNIAAMQAHGYTVTE